MRRIVFIVPLLAALAVPGCGSLEREELTLGDGQIARIAAVVGANRDPEAWRKTAEEVFEVSIEKLETKIDAASGAIAEVKVTLPALAKEAASKAGTSALEKIAENPTASGLAGAGMAAVVGIFGLLSRRSRLRREAKPA